MVVTVPRTIRIAVDDSILALENGLLISTGIKDVDIISGQSLTRTQFTEEQSSSIIFELLTPLGSVVAPELFPDLDQLQQIIACQPAVVRQKPMQPTKIASTAC